MPFANPNGIVNLDAVAVTGRRSGLLAFWVDLNKRAMPSVPAHIRLVGAVHLPAVSSWLAGRSQAVPDICGPPILVHEYAPNWTAVGETSIRIQSNSTQQFTYQRSQNSSLGVAVSGPNGRSESGNASWSSTSGVAFQTFGSNVSHRYKTGFKYGEYSNSCTTYAQVNDYFGGGQNPTQAAPSATHCASYPAGAVATFDSSSALQFSAAITIPDIGIGLSGQTGWDQDGSITYAIGSQSHQICGQNDGPGGDPRVVDLGLSS
jgi:hypothetical protein